MAKRLISPAAWAREQGFSKAYASKLVRTGRIVLVDGKIDPDDANARLQAQGDPIKRAQKLTRLTELTREELTNPSGVVGSTDPSEHDVRSDEIEAKLLPDHLLRARIKTEREAGRLKELDRRKREKELVDAQQVREEQLRRATDERDALLAWPSRIADALAGDLDVEKAQLLPLLRKYVRIHLAERSKQ